MASCKIQESKRKARKEGKARGWRDLVRLGLLMRRMALD